MLRRQVNADQILCIIILRDEDYCHQISIEHNESEVWPIPPTHLSPHVSWNGWLDEGQFCLNWQWEGKTHTFRFRSVLTLGRQISWSKYGDIICRIAAEN